MPLERQDSRETHPPVTPLPGYKEDSTTSTLNISSLSSFSSILQSYELRASNREPSTPQWCVSIPADCRQLAETVVTRVVNAFAHSNINRHSIVDYLFSNPGIMRAHYEHLEQMESLPQLREFFTKHLTRDWTAVNRLDLANRILEGDYQAATEAVRVLIAEESFFKKRKEVAIPFASAIAKEKQNQKLILDTLKEIGKDTPLLCPMEHFTTMALGTNRVLSNRPIIGPDIWNESDIKPPSVQSDNHPVLSITSSTDRKIEGFSFRYSFFETRCDLTEVSCGGKGSYKVVYPLISLDERVINALTDIINEGKSTGTGDTENRATAYSELSQSILKGIRDFSALGGHDTWHQLFYGVTGNPLNRFTFTSSDAYFQSSPDTGKGDGFNLQKFEMAGPFGSFENHAYLAHRAIWGKIIESREKVANGLIQRFGNYLGDLAELQPHLALRFGEELATRMVKYLAVVAYDQVALLMPHSKIEENHTRNRNGDTIDQAISRLNFPEYSIDIEKFSRLALNFYRDKDLVLETLKISLSRESSNDLTAEIIENMSWYFGYRITDCERYEEVAPLLSMLVLLDTSNLPEAHNDISSLVHEVRKLDRQSEHSIDALQEVFNEIAVRMLNIPEEKIPTLTLRPQSRLLFLEMAKICTKDRYRENAYGDPENRISLAFNFFLNRLRTDETFLEAVLSLSTKLDGLTNRCLMGYLVHRTFDSYLMASDDKLSGLRGFIAEQYDFNQSRLPWIDAFGHAHNPITNLHLFQRDLRESEALKSEQWSELKRKFDTALELIDTAPPARQPA